MKKKRGECKWEKEMNSTNAWEYEDGSQQLSALSEPTPAFYSSINVLINFIEI